MREQAIAFLQRVVRIRSVNPPGDELPVALALKELFDAHGVENRLVDLGNHRANLVAWLRGQGPESGRRVLALSGHTDVVPPGQVKWQRDPFSGDIENGRLYGRGSCDMKSGLVALAFALLELKAEGVQLNGDVKFLASAGEEAGAFGAKHFFDSGEMEGVSALLIGESTHHDVVVAHKGALWVEVICYGKTAHGSTPDQGVNAIVHMNRFLNALLDRFELVYEPDPLLGHPTFNVAVIEGGVKTNVVPDRCSVQIDFRTVPGQRHEDIVTALNRLLDELHEEDATFRGEVRVFNDLPPVGTDPDDPFVQTVVHSVREVVGRDPAVRGMNGYTDGAALAPPHSPVPLVILGGGDDHMAHQPDESVELEAFLQSIDVYKTVIRRYLA